MVDYAQLVTIANTEGWLGLFLPELPETALMDTLFDPRTLLDRTGGIARESGLRDHHLPWQPSASIDSPGSLQPALTYNVDRLRSDSGLGWPSETLISAHGYSSSSRSTIDAIAQTLDVLYVLSKRYLDSPKKMREWDHAVRNLLGGAIQEQLLVIVVQELAFYLGRQGFRLDGAPRSIEECSDILKEFDQRKKRLSSSLRRKIHDRQHGWRNRNR